MALGLDAALAALVSSLAYPDFGRRGRWFVARSDDPVQEVFRMILTEVTEVVFGRPEVGPPLVRPSVPDVAGGAGDDVSR